jgi:uncharacterized membrane protein (DUF2068 family)
MKDNGTANKPPRDRGLAAIAIFKLVKTILLIGVALGAFHFTTPGAMQSAERWVGTVSSSVGRRELESLLAKAGGFGKDRILVAGIAALAYALLFAVEGTGLWLQKRWAEWLSVVATASFIPLEIYELVKKDTPMRIVALIVNVATVVYLVVRLFRTRHDHGRQNESTPRKSPALVSVDDAVVGRP